MLVSGARSQEAEAQEKLDAAPEPPEESSE